MKWSVCILFAVYSSHCLAGIHEEHNNVTVTPSTTTEAPTFIDWLLDLFFRVQEEAAAKNITAEHSRVARQMVMSPAQLIMLRQRQHLQHNQALALAQLNQALLNRRQNEDEDDTSEEDDDIDSDEFWDNAPVNRPENFAAHPMLNGGFQHRSGQFDESPKDSKPDEVTRQASSMETIVLINDATTSASTTENMEITEVTDTTFYTDSTDIATTEIVYATETTETDSTVYSTWTTEIAETDSIEYSTATTKMTQTSSTLYPRGSTKSPENIGYANPVKVPPYTATIKCRCGVESKIKTFSRFTQVKTLQPWVVSINTTDRHLCTGSIINSKNILTAASCVSGIQASLLRIGAGIGDPDKRTVLIGHRIHIHPSYNEKKKYNNIAVIQIKEDVQPTKFISYICLPFHTTKQASGGTLVTLLADYRDRNTTVLQESVEPCQCNKFSWLKRVDIPPGSFCSTPPKNFCGADIGGAFIQRNRIYSSSISGVISTTAGCKSKFKPAVFTDVSKYMHWILRASKTGAFCSYPKIKMELLHVQNDQPTDAGRLRILTE